MGLMKRSEKEQFTDHLRTHFRGCSICGGKNVDIGDVVSLPILERAVPSGIAPGTQLIPVIPVICGQCGAISTFKAAGFFSAK